MRPSAETNARLPVDAYETAREPGTAAAACRSAAAELGADPRRVDRRAGGEPEDGDDRAHARVDAVAVEERDVRLEALAPRDGELLRQRVRRPLEVGHAPEQDEQPERDDEPLVTEDEAGETLHGCSSLPRRTIAVCAPWCFRRSASRSSCATCPCRSRARARCCCACCACGVCRTDLHVVDGELPHPKLPLVPGHQIVGETADGRRLGVPWLGWTCGRCRYCTSGRENLCDEARFTGYDLDGGYAEYAVADERFCFPIPGRLSTTSQAAPLLCAGLIGYRSLRLAGDAERLGLYGFGASAHIVAQVARASGAAAVRVRARRATRPRARSRSSSAASGPAAPTSCRPSSSTRRSSSRPAGALVPGGAARGREGRRRRVRRAST